MKVKTNNWIKNWVGNRVGKRVKQTLDDLIIDLRQVIGCFFFSVLLNFEGNRLCSLASVPIGVSRYLKLKQEFWSQSGYSRNNHIWLNIFLVKTSDNFVDLTMNQWSSSQPNLSHVFLRLKFKCLKYERAGARERAERTTATLEKKRTATPLRSLWRSA